MMKKTWKKTLAVMLSLAMAASGFSGFSAQVKAAETGEVTVEKSADGLTIGNGYISREFSTAGNKLSTVNITNKRTDNGDTVFTPAEGSEEFIIKTVKAADPGLSKTGWTAAADSWQGTGSDGEPAKAIDGDTSTLWHSGYNSSAGINKTGMPMNFVINLGKVTEFAAFGYTGRSNGNNGRINGYEIYLYNGSGETLGFDDAAWGSAVKSGSFQNGSDEQYVDFGQKVTATQIRIKITSSYGGTNQADQFGSAAEFSLYETAPNAGGADDTVFAASALTLADTAVEETTAIVNNVEKTGQKVTFEFVPYTHEDVEYTIKEVVVMYDGDSFMRKHLEISVPEEQTAKSVIEYIDLENTNIADTYLTADTYWTIPEQSNNSDMANMKGDYLELGQPYYLAAMYWGCEFPETENKIREGNAFIRYHYGKTLEKDAHFEYHKNNTAGKMVTWDAVVGAARSTDYSVVQADFYEYIETIAVDTDFRQQYNSWYDNMKNITKENLERSFSEIEKGFTQKGINPLDSYVADDGWINYSSFWDFDESKFPNELYDASLQAEQMGSRFGLWLGPRGGYGTQTTISNWIANNGLGSVNAQSGNDINISDARYLNKLRDDIFIGYQNKFGVNYWKLDGMLLEPSKTASEYYTTTNAFATISETYERWTDIYEDMREAKTDGDLWINMTSYTNPSPWHVQWVNSVWMQNTGDTGYNNSFEATDQQAMLTYRDNAYYNFLKERQWQLPNKYFYNHDPVYGLTANDAYNRADIEYTTEELRDHLYMLGTRGTAFWEYYYSYSMFDDAKWDVNAEAARWIEDNFDILQKSQMIGGKPADGDIYGFSCWNGNEGIVSLRNPKNAEQTYTLTFDRLIGVGEGTENVYGKVIIGDISYQNDDAVSYGDSVQITLPAKEVLIVQYGEKDETPAAIDSVHATAAGTIEVEFDEAIREPEAANFAVAGNTVTGASLNADRRTVVLTLADEMNHGAAFTVNVSGVKDTVGNETTDSDGNEFYQNEKVVSLDNASLDGSAAVTKDAAASVDGKEGFTVIGKFSTASENATILEQKDAYKVSIRDGYLVFELNNGLTVQSKYTSKTVNRSTGVVTSEDHGVIADGETHTFAAVKEINGMIKLYIDGKLAASAYDEAKLNPVLAKGELVFGEGLAAEVEYITVLDTALAFDEVEAFVALPEENLQITEGLTATTSGNVNETESNIANIFDGDPETYWNSNTVDQIAAGNPNAVVDLGEVYTIDRIDYSPRYHSGSEYWACTGNIKKLVLEVSADGETWTTVTAEGGLDLSDKIVKTADLSFFPVAVTFEETEARYVRISGTESYHWQYGQDGKPDNRNKSITIGDIAVFKAAETEEAFTTYTEEDPFVLPGELNASATLEAEHMIIKNTGTDERWPMQVTEADWASNGKFMNAMNNGDSAALYYNAPAAGTYTVTLTFRSGASANGFSWAEADGKITAGSVTAGANDSAGATHTATMTLEVVEAGAGLLTFTANSAGAPQMDKFDIVLTAVPEEPEEPEKPEEPTEVCEIFPDVEHGAWYEGAVQFVYDEGIMSGSNGMFNPTKYVTRAQIVTALYNLEGAPEVTDYSVCDKFADVDQTAWYIKAVSWACREGVASGNTATMKFNPNANVTRQQLATFFYKYAEYKEMDVTIRGDYSDLAGADQVLSYAEDAMQWAYGTGVITGNAAGLNPRGEATRAQLASILMRFMQNF